VSAEDLARIEQELAISLPPAYCETLLRPEFQNEAAGFQEFSGDADEVIGLNLELRNSGFCGIKWPAHYFVLGEDGAGNFYFTDLKKERPVVFLADHELTTVKGRLTTSESYETFPQFVSFLLRLQSETDAAFPEDEEISEPEIRKKPWWKMW